MNTGKVVKRKVRLKLPSHKRKPSMASARIAFRKGFGITNDLLDITGNTVVLTWKEFIFLTFNMHLPLNYIVRHIGIIKRWGVALVFIANLLTTIAFSMPLYTVYKFFGHYSKQSYIKYWKCVPLLKGIAYTLAFHSILLHTVDIAISGLALLYIPQLFKHHLPWSHCKFEGADKHCMEALFEYDKDEHVPHLYHNHICCNELASNCSLQLLAQHLAKYSMLDFYMGHMLKVGYDKVPRVKGLLLRWVASVAFIWMVIFLFLALDFRRFRKILIPINKCMLYVLLPISLFTLYYSPSYSSTTVLRSNRNDMLDFWFWIETTLSSLLKEIPGELIAYSCISSPEMGTTADSVTIYAIKITFIAILTAWLSVSAKFVQDNYNIQDEWCIKLEGDILMFALIPDAVQRWTLGRLWILLYFLVIFYWGFSVCVCIINAFVTTLLEEFPFLKKMRVVVAGIICLLVGLFNIMQLYPNYMENARHFMKYTLLPVQALVICLCLIGLTFYTIDRIRTDFQFIHGESLSWINAQGVKAAIFVVSTMGVATFVRAWFGKENKIILYLLVAPIPLWMVIVIAQFMLKKRETIFNADSKWGVPSRRIRNARQHYDPTYDLHHEVICRHHCLHNLPELKQELIDWQNNKDTFAERYALMPKQIQ